MCVCRRPSFDVPLRGVSLSDAAKHMLVACLEPNSLHRPSMQAVLRCDFLSPAGTPPAAMISRRPRPVWVPDAEEKACAGCGAPFSFFRRRQCVGGWRCGLCSVSCCLHVSRRFCMCPSVIVVRAETCFVRPVHRTVRLYPPWATLCHSECVRVAETSASRLRGLTLWGPPFRQPLVVARSGGCLLHRVDHPIWKCDPRL
jgi:hypothetical protein